MAWEQITAADGAAMSTRLCCSVLLPDCVMSNAAALQTRHASPIQLKLCRPMVAVNLQAAGCVGVQVEGVWAEIRDRVLRLMRDVFGNYVVQKLLEHPSWKGQEKLAEKLQGQVLTLSQQMYGCRVVQTALTVCPQFGLLYDDMRFALLMRCAEDLIVPVNAARFLSSF